MTPEEREGLLQRIDAQAKEILGLRVQALLDKALQRAVDELNTAQSLDIRVDKAQVGYMTLRTGDSYYSQHDLLRRVETSGDSTVTSAVDTELKRLTQQIQREIHEFIKRRVQEIGSNIRASFDKGACALLHEPYSEDTREHRGVKVRKKVDSE